MTELELGSNTEAEDTFHPNMTHTTSNFSSCFAIGPELVTWGDTES